MEELESYVIDNALKEKIVADFKEQVESVNDALERLKAEDIPCDLPTLKKIMSSDESFKKWLAKDNMIHDWAAGGSQERRPALPMYR